MSQTTILVVEDEPSILEVVSLYLARAGYAVREARDGRAALEALDEALPDLVVLDLNLPEIDGLEVARTLRGRADTPIIMLTSRREESERILGLELGADDYVTKPFSPPELVSRVRAVLRRSVPKEDPGEALALGDLRIDPRTRELRVGELRPELTAREFDLMLMLARHPRQVFSRDQLLEHVWGITEHIDPSTVTVHVRRLREKIEADPSNPRRIVTVWGVGYRFEP